MSFDPREIRTREHQKFRLDSEGEVAVKVIAELLGDPLLGVVFEYIKATYPDPVTEVYTFYDNKISLNIQASITIKYLAADKANIDDVEFVVV